MGKPSSPPVRAVSARLWCAATTTTPARLITPIPVMITPNGLPVTSSVPVFVDPQAYIGHTGELTSSIVTDVNWKTFVGQASGESYQMKFSGTGTVPHASQ